MQAQIDMNSVSIIVGLILSLSAIIGLLFKVFKKFDKIDKIDIILVKVEELEKKFIFVDVMKQDFEANAKESETKITLLSGLKDDVKEISTQLEEVKEETRFNTSMNKVDTEVLEALADHAIKTQNANGKVHRSLEMLEKLKFNNPKFS